MTYFSNGSEGEMWEESNCHICPLGQEACPVMLAHMVFNYRQIVDGKQEGPLADVLNMFIPTNEKHFADDCVMRKLIEKKCSSNTPPKGLIPLPGFKIDNQTENPK